ncbi:MAG: hypothetical protein RLN60_03190 [Phycisphaerales bacterium]
MDTLGGKPTFRAAFENAALVALNEERALIRLGEHEQLEFARMNSQTLADTFKAVTGVRLRVAFEAPEPESGPLDTQVITPELKKDAESNPLVRRAMELFDARIVRVEERRPGGQPPSGQSTEGTDG